MRNAAAMLAPGGRLRGNRGRPAPAPATAPSTAARCGPGSTTATSTRDDLAGWLRGPARLEALEAHPDRGDVYALARKAARCASCLSTRRRAGPPTTSTRGCWPA